MPKLRLATWPHFARPTLAARYLQPATEFGVRAVTIFGPRGTGKTEFLKRDLIPLAAQRGLLPVYADIWQSNESPAAAIARACLDKDLEASLQRGSARLVDRARELLTRPVTRLQAEIDLLGNKASVEANLASAAPPVSTEEVGRLIEAFAVLMRRRRGRPVLLIIDEIQALAVARFESLVKTLRSLFEAHDDHVVRVFTGSSHAGLERMFRRSKAPLFGQGGSIESFPPLSREFVQSIDRWFAQRTGGVPLNQAAAWEGFQRLNYSARLFRTAVEMVLLGSASDIKEACAAVRAALLSGSAMFVALNRLSALQLLVLQQVWRNGADLYGAATLRSYKKKIDGRITPAIVQAALQRLERMELVFNAGHGEYRIESPELELALEELETAAVSIISAGARKRLPK